MKPVTKAMEVKLCRGAAEAVAATGPVDLAATEASCGFEKSIL